MNTHNSTEEQLNKLIEFRQTVYDQFLTARRDAQFETLDALLLKGRVPSFPWLATAGCFQRVLSFRIWYLFGHVVPCWYKHGDHLSAMLKPGDISSSLIARLVNLVTKISEITLLDWFVTDLVVTNGRKGERVIIQEPANALAGFVDLV